MNYGIWIIALSLINVLTIFSGFPTGTKKWIIVVTTLILLGIGCMLRAVEQKRRKAVLARAERLEKEMAPDLDRVADKIAHDVEEHVDEEIEHIISHDHYTHDN